MNTVTRTIGATLSLAAITGLSVALPASAATQGEWGTWDSMFLTLEFDNPAFPDATFTVNAAESWENLVPADWAEGFTAADPLGQLIGANRDSTEPLYLNVETQADNNVRATVDIVFDSPVPANQLVVAISDIDSDRTEIQMWDGDDDPLSYFEILSGEEDFSFNWDDPSNVVDVPSISSYSQYTITVGNAPDGTDGSTVWMRPTVEVKSMEIHINTEDGDYSDQRIWIGQVVEVDTLADTGVNESLYLLAVTGGAIIALGGFISLRRRVS